MRWRVSAPRTAELSQSIMGRVKSMPKDWRHTHTHTHTHSEVLEIERVVPVDHGTGEVDVKGLAGREREGGRRGREREGERYREKER
jgi:hypothetical protein